MDPCATAGKLQYFQLLMKHLLVNALICFATAEVAAFVAEKNAENTKGMTQEKRKSIGMFKMPSMAPSVKKKPTISDVISDKMKLAQSDCFHLAFQNLLYAPEVKTSLQRLRISAPVACKSVVLKAIAETGPRTKR